MLHLNLLFPTRKHSNTLIGFLLVSRIFSKQKFLFLSFSNSELKEKKSHPVFLEHNSCFKKIDCEKKKKTRVRQHRMLYSLSAFLYLFHIDFWDILHLKKIKKEKFN